MPDALQSMIPGLITYSVILSLLDLVVVSLRLYVRLRVIRKFGLDDWGVAATLVRFLLLGNDDRFANKARGGSYQGATDGGVIFITAGTCDQSYTQPSSVSLDGPDSVRAATKIGLGMHIDTLSMHEKSTLLKVQKRPWRVLGQSITRGANTETAS
jgi:hypothetical protein